MGRIKKSTIIFWLMILGGSLLLLASWRVEGFADAYVKYVYPAWIETYGRLTGLAPISVGEIMLYLFAGYVAIVLLTLILRFVMFVNRSEAFKAVNRLNLKVLAWLLAIIFMIQTLNCFIAYHTTPLYAMSVAATKADADHNAATKAGADNNAVAEADVDNNVATDAGADNNAPADNAGETDDLDTSRNRGFTISELFSLREMLVNRANELAISFERDERGDIIYDGDMKAAAISAMQKLGEAAAASSTDGTSLMQDFTGHNHVLAEPLSRLTGYYSVPKALIKSDFFTQQYMKGYFFPFSMEANYNDLMYIANFPDTFCHELSHFKGFILEDEASFIAYLACINSGDEFFEYSGILEALAYVNNDCAIKLTENPSIAEVVNITPRNNLVVHDMIFVSEENWEKIEEDAVISTEIVHEASDAFLETNLTVNGIEDGVESYSRVVDLLLTYYFDE